ncbi:MAG: MdtA/MuxA family multidrug efflux RND transporter periplasmic adaptor subunit [Alphaproteobacteria bacterium]
MRVLGKRAQAQVERLRNWGRRLPGGERTMWIGIAGILLVFFIWAIRPGTEEDPEGRFGGGPTPVSIVKAEQTDIAVTMNALGTVTPLATVTVKAQVAGTLVRINFQEGQMVTAGEILAEIDPRSYQAALDQAHGQLLRDQAQLANARLDLQRYRTLLSQNSIARQQVDTQAAAVRQAEATMKADQAAVETAAINLGYTKIVSPVSGRVGLRQMDVGNVVDANSSGIVIVTQLQPISVLFSVPEDSIDSIMQRLKGGATLGVEAYDRGQTRKLATGTLSTVDNQIDPATGTVKLRAMFDNADERLFPNQFVNVRLVVSTLCRQTAVPAAAIQRGTSGIFVFVVKADSTVSMRPVTLGPTDGEKIAVTRGLKPGETVVVDGTDRLRDGAMVILPGAQRPQAGEGRGRGSGRGRSRGGRP